MTNGDISLKIISKKYCRNDFKVFFIVEKNINKKAKA